LIVVSDTTAITSLMKIGRAEILAVLFHEVVIPEAVRDELAEYHATLPRFLLVKSVADRAQVTALLKDLEAGEAEAILLAMELGADVLLIDERRGRKIAEAKGIACLGLAGALLLAKRRGVIPSVATLLDELETGARFYLAADLKREILDSSGE
jgi:predicted nucleic acid-binding protein